nr:immunoglobulin heavy chain junction region [Macaca mulatta]MOX66588.1 immunoglobulin heavy chain junction region [Macaca mulatta]MOX66857.1 immunoglobulin heavy chain junction region [Macaca mulatta]
CARSRGVLLPYFDYW